LRGEEDFSGSRCAPSRRLSALEGRAPSRPQCAPSRPLGPRDARTDAETRRNAAVVTTGRPGGTRSVASVAPIRTGGHAWSVALQGCTFQSRAMHAETQRRGGMRPLCPQAALEGRALSRPLRPSELAATTERGPPTPGRPRVERGPPGVHVPKPCDAPKRRPDAQLRRGTAPDRAP
jgi:hypothetical protein